MTGRPTLHTPELEAKVLALLSEHSMVKVCARDDMPSRQTLYVWMDTIEGFSDKYARSVQERADYHAERIADTADKVLKGVVDPQAGRVAIDADKWIACKLKPQRDKRGVGYGDKLDIGNADGQPFQVIIAK